MTNQETLLKATCKITKAKWSALLTCIDEGWRYEATHGLTKGRRAALQTFIQQPKTAVWLAGGLSSGRIRSRATGASLKTLQCVRIYAFPDGQHQTMLLAGADDLDKLARDTFRLVHHALSTVAASAQHLQARTEAQKQAEARLIQSARLAAVGEMAAGVAHELNNPLTTIAGFVELVLADLPASQSRQDLELVLQEAQRAREVVRRLLDFSRQGESLRVKTDVNEIVGEVVAMIHYHARISSVELYFESWHGLPEILLDRNQIKQIILNLAYNALQAMPKGGTLRLQTMPETRDQKSWIIIKVEDTGVGISEADQARIFEPFFTTKPAGIGTGLGLSISYGIVADHSGFIEVESQPGAGSCFTVWLPLED